MTENANTVWAYTTPWKDSKVGVLYGGLGPEREISIKTGTAIARSLRASGYAVEEIDVTRDLDLTLRKTPIDVAFLALHGPYGEDGCVQGFLELRGIPYTGSSVLSSALAMDKLKSKELFRLYNVPTAPYYALEAEAFDRLEEVHGSFGFPAFVKPRRSGSSVGAGAAHSMTELTQRVREALKHDSCALVERFVKGKEVAVAVVDGKAIGGIEIVPQDGFYDYEAKYQKGTTEYHYPARLHPTRYRGVLNLAERAHQALGCRGATRVDLLVTEGENEYVLEVNTLPGMTQTSLLPKIAGANGCNFDSLCEWILAGASLGVTRTDERGAKSRPQADAHPAA